jgi:hypothetical protein
MPSRDYTGPSIDVSWQDLKDRPYKGEGKTVGDTKETEGGSVTVEGLDSLPTETDKRRMELVDAFRFVPDEPLLEVARNHDGDIELIALYELIRREGWVDELVEFVDVWNGDTEWAKQFIRSLD